MSGFEKTVRDGPGDSDLTGAGPWMRLVQSFVRAEMDGPTFERVFLNMFKDEVSRGISQRYAIDLLFYEVDAYCADPSLFGPGDITEDQLRQEAERCLQRWDEPWPPL